MSSRGSVLISAGQDASASGVTGGTSTGSTGRFSRAGEVVPSISAAPPVSSSAPPTTLASTITATTTGTRTAVAISAIRRRGSTGGRRPRVPGASGPEVFSVRALRC